MEIKRNRSIRVGIIGDYDPGYISHKATCEALNHAANHLSQNLETSWLPTQSLEAEDSGRILDKFDSLWCAPGSPYKSMQGALRAIRYARETDTPFLGTCGGFQYTMVEYARNVLGVQNAEHEETSPDATDLVISKLSCSLAGRTQKVRILTDTQTHRIYGKEEVIEEFRCNYGLNHEYREKIGVGGLKVAGVDCNGEIRIVELPDHPFFIATLFLPQLSSSAGNPHPLITACLKAGAVFH